MRVTDKQVAGPPSPFSWPWCVSACFISIPTRYLKWITCVASDLRRRRSEAWKLWWRQTPPANAVGGCSSSSGVPSRSLLPSPLFLTNGPHCTTVYLMLSRSLSTVKHNVITVQYNPMDTITVLTGARWQMFKFNSISNKLTCPIQQCLCFDVEVVHVFAVWGPLLPTLLSHLC